MRPHTVFTAAKVAEAVYRIVLSVALTGGLILSIARRSAHNRHGNNTHNKR